MKDKSELSYSNIVRLPRYYRFLSMLSKQGKDKISSAALAEIMGVTSSQIRQDFSCFGLSGQQGYGYSVSQLLSEIGILLGLSEKKSAILIGAGNIGTAVANLSYDDKGFEIKAAFDKDKSLIGKSINGIRILDISSIGEYVKNAIPECAFLCIPEDSAPEIVRELYELGVKCFWNFSHYDIKTEYTDAKVENVHLGDSLMRLSYLMSKQ